MNGEGWFIGDMEAWPSAPLGEYLLQEFSDPANTLARFAQALMWLR